METSKNLKRKEKITYDDILDLEDGVFEEKFKRYGWKLDSVEGFIYDQNCYWWAKDEVSRLLDFVAIVYCELKYANEISDRYRNEMAYDIPVWDSGEVDKLLDDDEKQLVHEHLAVIKEYLNNKGISCPGETQ